ncbi:Ribosomal L13 and P16-Arc domain containing prote in [Trichuris trichiura]|uniref:Large ribosomal subunit protein uL13 n=1 Tax=Trichuris trichiura TaxID=36087 RepID=A0A077Z0G1_TRITR|nr:Ribosomal L13 and P16-Arc domain containing prote in [Trichuris trichiura]
MAKATNDTSFRQIDVDLYNEDVYKEDEELDAGQSGPDDAEVTSLLNRNRPVEALKAALKNPPLRVKAQQVKDRSTQTVVRVLCSIKQADIEAAVDHLDPAQLDLLMKYIYKGFEAPHEGSSTVLLAWHRVVVKKAGIGCVVRVLADRSRLYLCARLFCVCFSCDVLGMGFSAKPIVVDAKGHLMGRLAAVVSKELLLGQRIVVVRCEKMNISGSFYRNKLKYLAFLRKRCNINPKRGPFHLRAPGKIFWRVVRGMLPHKTYRAKQALMRLRAYEGVPPKYQKVKRKVVPCSMRVNCLDQRRKFCELGRLSSEVGWKYKGVIEALEEKRKARGLIFLKAKREESNLKKQAFQNIKDKIEPYQKVIEAYGYK